MDNKIPPEYPCPKCGNKIDTYNPMMEIEQDGKKLCGKCIAELITQWQKEDNLPGGGILFTLPNEEVKND